MGRLNRFAPVSGAPSSLVGVAAMYFMFGGVLIALFTLLPPIIFPEVRAGHTPFEFATSILLSLAVAAGMFWTGTLLAAHSRRGAWYALGFILLSLITSFDTFSLTFGALSLIVLATIWRDLK